MPFYRRRPVDPAVLRRVRMRNDTALHVSGPGNEQDRMDFRPVLGQVRCPVLVMAGAHDPLVPPAVTEALGAALPPDRMRVDRFAECSHDLFGDAPERAFAVLRDFIGTAT